MICPHCNHDNPAGNKFCGECGAELVAVCPSCGTANPPGTKFCGECGTDLRADAPAAVTPTKAEQRLVSVLFADLVGFTPFSESRDSEEVRDLLTTYFDRSRDIVERFGGTVDKFIGDAVMAVWGAVESHEDDAERSVRAALDLVDMVSALGEELAVPDLELRVGVTSGETSVGPGGNEKGLVVGDLVNIASRLQSIAEPDTVLIGEATCNLVDAAIECRPMGKQQVKGKDEPVSTFRPLRIVGELGGARRAEGIEGPFTGREVELRLLKDQLHACAKESSARLVSVVGEAGVGKSRLSWELEKYIDGLAVDVYWHRGRSPSYGEGLTMWALGEMIRSRARIADTDDAAKSRIKLRTAVAEYVSSEEDRRWLEPRLAALLGLEDAPSGDRQELFAAIRTFFHHIADRGPTALVFEDLHWADAGLLDFVADLVERSPRHPIFVVTLARPELLEANPGWGSGRGNFVSVHLSPLADTTMSTLVSGMVPGISDEAVAAIVSRAAGIPLYAVEFVRMLVASGELEERDGRYRLVGDFDDLALPESLQALVGAGLDRLSAGDRQLIQDAAVLGRSFTIEGLAIIRQDAADSLAEPLGGLVRQQLLEIEDDRRSPEYGQYRFVQSVIREVAYGRLTKNDRYSRHLRVAEYFESLGEVELVGAVATHYLAAAEAAPSGEGSDLLRRGRTALSEAAARAAALQSHAVAISLLEQALQLAETSADRAPLLEAAANSAAWAADPERAIEMAAEAAQAYQEVGDGLGLLRAVTAQAFTLSSNFRADESVALLGPVYDRIDAPSTSEEVALALETARAYMLNNQPEPAVEILDRVLGIAERVLSPAQVIDGIVSKATAMPRLGRTIEAIALLKGAVTLADEHGLQPQALRALNNLAVVRAYDAPRVDLDWAEDFMARSRRLGAEIWLYRSMNDSVGTMIAHGEFDRAEALLDELELVELPDLERTTTRFNRLQIQILRGGSPELLEEAMEVASAFDGTSDTQMLSITTVLKATVSLLKGNHRAAFDMTIGDTTPSGFLLMMFSALALGDLERVEQAMAAIEEHGVRGRLTRAYRMIAAAGALVIQGDSEAAAAAFVEAIDSWERVVNPMDVVLYQAVACMLLGRDHPEGRRVGLESLGWIRSKGAHYLEELWAEWLPIEEAASETA